MVVSLVVLMTVVFASAAFAGQFMLVKDNKVPPNAFIAGKDVGGQPLAICRAQVTKDGKKGVAFGKAGNHLGGAGNCRVEFDDKVLYFKEFDVLTMGSYVPAGPIWSDAEAPAKCEAACKPYGGWVGKVATNWYTTLPGKMSVCQCKTDLGFAVIMGQDAILQ
jgi:hypothetical protein